MTPRSFRRGRFTAAVLMMIVALTGAVLPTAAAATDRGNTYYISNSFSGGQADATITYGLGTDDVYAGDWDGNGADSLTLRRGNTYYIKNTISGGNADKVIAYGKATDTILVGDWDGNGTDTLAVRRGNTYYIKNTISGGNADKIFAYGKATDITLVGDWDGNGTDTFALRRPPASKSASSSGAASASTGSKNASSSSGAVSPVNNSCPAGYPIKGNVNSKGEKIYHTTSSRSYSRTNPEQCFATAADASRAGYRAARD